MKLLVLTLLFLVGCTPQYALMVKKDTGERVECKQPMMFTNPGQQLIFPAIFPQTDYIKQCVEQHEALGFVKVQP